MILSRNMLKRVGESRHPCWTLNLIIEVFGDLDQVGTNVVFLHGCPQSCSPNPVEGLLEVYEDMAKVLLMLEIFHTKHTCI